MNLYDIYRKSILVACAGLAMQSSGASGVENIEDLWIGGVFDTRIMTPATDVASKLDFSDPMPLTDADGNTNELILMPDYADSSFIKRAVPPVNNGTGRRPEDVLLDAVNGNNAVTLAELGNPTDARHLIRADRLDETRRIFLTKDDPEERLHRYLVLRYPTINAAKNAERRLNNIPGIAYAGINRMLEYSFTPNDTYFQVKSQPAFFQWGMRTMEFPAAWDRTTGHGYVGVVDSIVSTTHPDISSVRSQLSFTATSPGSAYAFHGQHVTGIIAGSQNNGVGVSGGCPNCSVALGQASPIESGVTAAIYGLADRGIPTINMSFGKNGVDCNSNVNMKAICDAIEAAGKRDILFVAAAGNGNKNTPDFPANLSLLDSSSQRNIFLSSSVLSVGGVQHTPAASWDWWNYDAANGSSWAGIKGVLAPAKSIVSTVPVGSAYSNAAWVMCGDIAGYDQSGVYNDGYGSCTGTSMAAPHITALAGILRSINPRLSASSIKSAIQQSGDRHAVPSDQFGYGVPNAGTAVNNSITNSNPRRLTPLFAFYSNMRQDYFYTTVPQMGVAALNGTLQPAKYPTASSSYSAVGWFVNGYSYFPGMAGITPGAQVWIFTTPENPKSATIPLAPLYRLSWKCGDAGVSPACATTNNYHTDFVYTADSSGVSAYLSVGYKLDGIEGYIYPKTITQPVGTVRLMRKYNPVRDDHAIFPESELANMTAQGYTQNSGSDWLGYVYPNVNGNMPIY